MANWKTVQERWLPIVEKMEEHSMDDYAIPEIYRAAEKDIDNLLSALMELDEWFLEDESPVPFWPNREEAERAYALAKVVADAISQHKGE